MSASEAVAFKSPPSLQVTVSLPNSGKISGMGIKPGVTVIVGGGFHVGFACVCVCVHGVCVWAFCCATSSHGTGCSHPQENVRDATRFDLILASFRLTCESRVTRLSPHPLQGKTTLLNALELGVVCSFH